MPRILFIALAGVLFIGLSLPGSAAAQCWWTGLGGSCSGPPFAYRPPPAYSDPAFGYYDRTRGVSPYAAYGAGSHMGPDPGGGYFHAGSTNIGHTD